MSPRLRVLSLSLATLTMLGPPAKAASDSDLSRCRDGVSFDGDFFDSLFVPHSFQLQNESEFSVETWVHVDSLVTDRTILEKGDGFSNFSNRAYRLFVHEGALVANLFFSNADSGEALWLGTAPLVNPTRQWHHLAVTFSKSAGEAVLYLNGQAVNRAVNTILGTPLSSVTLRQSTFPLYLGSDWLGRTIEGTLDEVRVWATARSAEDIARWCYAEPDMENGQVATYHFDGDLSDSSGSHHSAPIGDPMLATACSQWPDGCSYLHLPLATDSIDVPHDDALNPVDELSIEVSLRATTFNGSFVNKGDGISATTERSYDLRLLDGRLFAEVFLGPVGQQEFLQLSTLPELSVPLGEWVHVALTYSSTEGRGRLYCNGVMVSSRTRDTGNNPLQGQLIRRTPAHDLQIGRGASGGFVGDLDELRLWNLELRQREIIEKQNWMFDWGGDQVASYHFDGHTVSTTGAPKIGVPAGGAFIPGSPQAYSYGFGHPGTNGIPSLRSTRPFLGRSHTLTLGNSAAGPTVALMFVGLQATDATTTKGGGFYTVPFFSMSLPLVGSEIALSYDLPDNPALDGLPIFVQAIQADDGASKGLSFTQGLLLALGD